MPSRADNSTLGRWWWSVDRASLIAIFVLMMFGYVLMQTASPAVAQRLHQAREMLLLKQVVFLALAGVVMIVVSLMTPKQIRQVALIGCASALLLTALTLVMGVSIKGGRRWLALPGLSIQPSEFLKPCFAVTAAWLMAQSRRVPGFRGTSMSIGIWGLIALLLPMQPDIGMLAVITMVFAIQLYLSGVPLYAMGLLGGIVVALAGVAYVFSQHVHDRVQIFLHPDHAVGKGDSFQLHTAMQAFGNGGLLGRGPGEGRVKDILPDAHADFVFAVAGEEFGLLICLLIMAVFVFIVLRGLQRAFDDPDQFCALAAGGLVASFGLQAFINLASTLGLIPTKGMTLPFISYGGSSAIAVAFGLGMLLALTRRRFHGEGT